MSEQRYWSVTRDDAGRVWVHRYGTPGERRTSTVASGFMFDFGARSPFLARVNLARTLLLDAGIDAQPAALHDFAKHYLWQTDRLKFEVYESELRTWWTRVWPMRRDAKRARA